METELKKIGHNISLKGLVIHQVIKAQNAKDTSLKQAKNQIQCSEKEKLFIGRINNSYDKKSNPTYGIFGNEDSTFQNYLESYWTKTFNFYKFSVEAVKHYEKKLKSKIAATGGFVIFAHFLNTDSNNEYMLVLTTNNKDGYGVDENDLTINGTKNIDLNKVDVACKINLTRWHNIEHEDDKNSKTYLSFVRGNKEISRYFMEFIDCANKRTSTESSRNLFNAINAYCKTRKYEEDKKNKLKKTAFDYCSNCNDNNSGILLTTLSALINPDDPDDFREFASSEEYQVDNIISYDRNVLKLLETVKGKGNGWSIEFSKELLINKTIFYDDKNKSITINNVPESVINQIKL